MARLEDLKFVKNTGDEMRVTIKGDESSGGLHVTRISSPAPRHFHTEKEAL
jgi:hypothetical protein